MPTLSVPSGALTDQLAWVDATPRPSPAAVLSGVTLGDVVELDGRALTVRSVATFPEPVGGIVGVAVLGDCRHLLGWGDGPEVPLVRFDRASRLRCTAGDVADVQLSARWFAAHAAVSAATAGRVVVTVRPAASTLPTVCVSRSGERTWFVAAGHVPDGRVVVCRAAGPVHTEPAAPRLATVPVGSLVPTDAAIARMAADVGRRDEHIPD